LKVATGSSGEGGGIASGISGYDNKHGSNKRVAGHRVFLSRQVNNISTNLSRVAKHHCSRADKQRRA